MNNVIELHFKCKHCADPCRTEIKVDAQGGLTFYPRQVCLISSALDDKVCWEPIKI